MKKQISSALDHAILLVGVAFMVGPLAVLLWQLLSGSSFADLWHALTELWFGTPTARSLPAWQLLWNSLIVALGIALLKSVASILAAYAIVCFRLPARELLFAIILLSMFYPIETRILPTFTVVNQLGLLNSYAGMILPIVASGLGVLLFRIFLQQMPRELMEAARIDGAGPTRFFLDFVLPLSMPVFAALFAILFVLGWNQYVWPIMIATTSTEHETLMRGLASFSMQSREGLMLVALAIMPPGLIFISLQRFLVRGLTAGIH